MSADPFRLQHVYLAALNLAFVQRGPAGILRDLADIVSRQEAGNLLGRDSLSAIEVKLNQYSVEMDELCRDLLMKHEAVARN